MLNLYFMIPIYKTLTAFERLLISIYCKSPMESAMFASKFGDGFLHDSNDINCAFNVSWVETIM